MGIPTLDGYTFTGWKITVGGTTIPSKEAISQGYIKDVASSPADTSNENKNVFTLTADFITSTNLTESDTITFTATWKTIVEVKDEIIVVDYDDTAKTEQELKDAIIKEIRIVKEYTDDDYSDDPTKRNEDFKFEIDKADDDTNYFVTDSIGKVYGGTYKFKLILTLKNATDYVYSTKAEVASGSDGDILTITLYVKYQTVEVSGKYYTIEDALATASSGIVTVRCNTTFASRALAAEIAAKEGASTHYKQGGNYTVNSGVTLLVPGWENGSSYKANGKDITINKEEDDITGFVGASAGENNIYTPVEHGKGYSSLVLESGIELTVQGTFTINSLRLTGGALLDSMEDTRTSVIIGNNYGKVELKNTSKVILESGSTLNAMGYIYSENNVNEGTVEQIIAKEGSNVIETFAVPGWKGDLTTAGAYIPGTKYGILGAGMTGLPEASYNPPPFPISQYTFNSIISKVKMEYGSSYSVYISFNVNFGSIVSRTDAPVEFVSSSGNAFINMTSESIVYKWVDVNGVVHFETNKDINFKSLEVPLQLGGMSVSVTSEKFELPIPGNFSISINDGIASVPAGVALKLLPGATWTVGENAEIKFASGSGIYSYGVDNYKLNGISGNWQDGRLDYPIDAMKDSYYIKPNLNYKATSPVHFEVNGRLTAESGSKIGVAINGSDGATLNIASGTVLSDIKLYELLDDNILRNWIKFCKNYDLLESQVPLVLALAGYLNLSDSKNVKDTVLQVALAKLYPDNPNISEDLDNDQKQKILEQTLEENGLKGETITTYTTTFNGVAVNGDRTTEQLTEGLWEYQGGKWISPTYKIHYNYDDGGDEIDADATATYTGDGSATFTLAAAPERDGYTFLGWKDATGKTHKANGTITFNELKNLKIKADNGVIVLTAQWELQSYTITYQVNEAGADDDHCSLNGGDETYTIESLTITLPTVTAEAGYKFDGWYEDASYSKQAKVSYTAQELFELFKTSGHNATFYAKCTLITYTIKFDHGGHGTAQTEQKVNTRDDPTVTLPTLSEKGWTFGGWQINGAVDSYSGNVSLATLISGIGEGTEITLKAVWTQTDYNVTFDAGKANDASLNNSTTTIHLGGTVTIHVPTAVGYKFTAWELKINNVVKDANFTDSSFTLEESNISDDNKAEIVFTAQWEKIMYSVKYVSDGTDFTDGGKHAIDETITLHEKPTPKDGYVFLGYKIEGYAASQTYAEKASLTLSDISEYLATLEGDDPTITFVAQWSLYVHVGAEVLEVDFANTALNFTAMTNQLMPQIKLYQGEGNTVLFDNKNIVTITIEEISDLTNTYNKSSTDNIYGGTYAVKIGLALTTEGKKDNLYTLDSGSSLQGAEVTLYLKYKTVQISGDSAWYTIEDALSKGNSGTIIVKANTSFTSSSIAKAEDINYGTDSYTVDKDEILFVPCDDNNALIKENKDYKRLFNGSNLYCTLIVNQNLTVNGKFHINAARKNDGNDTARTDKSKGYSEVEIKKGVTVTLNSGSEFVSYGYTYGEGIIDALEDSTVKEPFALGGYKGGTISSKIMNEVFPINQYALANIISHVIIHKGASYNLQATVSGYSIIFVDEQLNFIGDSDSCFVELLSANSYMEKYVDENGYIHLEANGDVNFNNLTVNAAGTNLSTTNLQVPIPGNFKLAINSGKSTIPEGVSIKLLPGAELNVAKSAELDIKGSLYAYGNHVSYSGTSKWQDGNNKMDYPNSTVVDAYRTSPKFGYNASTPAKILIKGSVSVTGTLAADITGENGASVYMQGKNSGSIKEDYTTYSGPGGIFTTAKCFTSTITGYAIDEDNNSQALKNGTWSYNGGKWSVA